MTSTAPIVDLWCPSCESVVEEWAPGPGGRPAASCPTCWALERHRMLSSILRGLRPFVETASSVLEYSPQRQIRDVLQSMVGADRYVGIDLMDLRFADLQVDACHLPLADNSIDLIVQFHVLEHIPDDAAAMREMCRVLSPGGIALVQVPWRAGVPTDEDPSAPEAERLARFGQADHVRYYGADFEDRLRAAGLVTRRYSAADFFDADEQARYGVPGNQPLWVLRSSTGR